MSGSVSEGMRQVDVMSLIHFGVLFDELKRRSDLSCNNCADYMICAHSSVDICKCMEGKVISDLEVL